MNDSNKILIVDDERFHLNVMVELLGLDYKTVVAKSGEKALEIAASEAPPELILLDILMPGLDGYEVCRRLKADPRTRHIPVIFLTVKSDVEDETRGFALGAVDYITKPFSPPIVKARVKTQLALNRALRQVEAHNERLEQRVAARTREIVRAQEERERLQLQLQQAQKMEAIGQLTGGIAHDFNNILSSVTGFSTLALECVASAQQDELTEYLNQIYRAGERAGELVAQLLAFSRGMPGQAQPLKLAAQVRDVMQLLAPLLTSGIELSTDLDESAPAVVMDTVQLHQLVMNLCINARDAMAGRGALAVTLRYRPGMATQCSACRETVRGDVVELAVADEGSGMAPALLEKIFDPFFSTKAVGKGTGMGLSVVNGIVHSHHGHIQVDTDVGRGTTFRLMFPAVHGSEGQSAIRDSDNVQPAVAGKHIQVVDDEESVTFFLKELLETRGYRVTAYNDSTEALASLQARPRAFDLLITDQAMPAVTGMELARAALRLVPGLPVILCSGSPSDIDTSGLAREGVKGFLSKPLHSRNLLQLMDELLLNDAEASA